VPVQEVFLHINRLLVNPPVLTWQHDAARALPNSVSSDSTRLATAVDRSSH